VLQCVSVGCSELQCVAMSRCKKNGRELGYLRTHSYAAVCCGLLQCVAVSCSELVWKNSEGVGIICSVLQCVAVYRCSVLQCTDGKMIRKNTRW